MLKMKNINANLLLQLCVLAISLNTAFACHGTLLAAGITEEEKEIILREHNRLRQTVATGRYPGQPAAENMREIVWDDELADRAQKWAENCQFRHDPFRTINRFTMGQNLAIIWSTAPLDPDDGDFPSRIQNWFNEVQKYSFGDAWSPKTGHYSQLVWGETSLVGCGFAEYKDKSKYNKLYVCNYGPGGNVVGYNPYEAGKPSCSLYGMKPSKRYNGLCAAPDPSTVSDNAIETYEYKNTNSNNNNFNSFSAYNTKQTTQYSATTKFSNNNNKNSNSNNNNNNNSFKHTTTYSNTFKHQQATSTKSTSTASQKGGSSFGTKNYGGSQAFTTETAQQQQQQHQQPQSPIAMNGGVGGAHHSLGNMKASNIAENIAKDSAAGSNNSNSNTNNNAANITVTVTNGANESTAVSPVPPASTANAAVTAANTERQNAANAVVAAVAAVNNSTSQQDSSSSSNSSNASANSKLIDGLNSFYSNATGSYQQLLVAN
uniref:SCP domain-containing protein n=1 Tax=Musca domestica TaxID=7370 RepID=A0A1I8NCD4_MUSDO